MVRLQERRVDGEVLDWYNMMQGYSYLAAKDGVHYPHDIVVGGAIGRLTSSSRFVIDDERCTRLSLSCPINQDCCSSRCLRCSSSLGVDRAGLLEARRRRAGATNDRVSVTQPKKVRIPPDLCVILISGFRKKKLDRGI